MYKSPIDIIYGQMETQLEGTIMRAVQNVGVNVDKEELIRALNDDRRQYEEGYKDGRLAAMEQLVRCKDCKHCHSGYCNHFGYYSYAPKVDKDDFCSYGERREEANE